MSARILEPSPSSLRDAAARLRAGEPVAFPTETVYGLGGNALDDRAVAEIFAMKGRPEFNPLIVHCADASLARRYTRWNESAERLADRFWPGPLTLVLPRAQGCPVSLLASAGLDTLAVRVPAHPVARGLLQEAGIPLAAPSANRSGRVSPTLASHVMEELGGRLSVILDGGPCQVGLESTVIDLTGARPAILRPGSVTPEDLAPVLGETAFAAHDEAIKAPGMLKSHYAPSKAVRLDVTEPREDEGYLAFGAYAGRGVSRNLSASGDVSEAAANLFRCLRELDALAVQGIAVAPIPERGIGLAIRDRLRRAAQRP